MDKGITGPLGDQVFQQMLSRVRSGEWKPGTVLPGQRELNAEFGVSGLPLREALSMMKALGMLEIQQGRRTVVRRIDAAIFHDLARLGLHLEGGEGFRQIYEMRLAIEPSTAYLAAQRRTACDVDALSSLTAALRQHHDGDDSIFFDADIGFHRRIASAAGNALLSMFMETASGILLQAQTWGCQHSPERRLRAVHAHEAILDAIESQQPERARVEMEAHIRYSGTHYQREAAPQGSSP